MIGKLKFSLALVFALQIGQYATPGAELTKADIPPGLSPELKSLVEDTFSEKSEARMEAAVRFEKMGEKAAPAMPFMLRLLNDRDWHVADVAAGLLGNALGKQPSLRKAPGVAQALTRFCENADMNRRCDAVRLLAQSRIPGAYELLVKMLKDPESAVRESATWALGDLGDRRAQPVLREIVYSAGKHVDEYLREGCAAETVLGRVGDKEAFNLLYNVLYNWHTDKMFTRTDMREGAVAGLGFLRDREAIELLEWVLKDKLGHPYRVRAHAAAALAAIQGRDAVPLLKQFAVDRGEQQDVRRAAAVALVEVANGEVDDVEVVVAVCFPSEEGSDPALLAIARHGRSKAVRAAAQRYLSKSDLESLRKEGLLVTPQEASEEAKKQKH